MTNRHELLPCGRVVIYIQGGGFERATLIDAADLPKVAAIDYAWYAQRRRWTWYAAATVYKDGRKSTIRLHRYLMDAPDGMEVDHLDHDGLKNTRDNLRLVTPFENRENMREWGFGGDVGRRWYERGCKDFVEELEELPFI